jgi:hypothetical protein
MFLLYRFLDLLKKYRVFILPIYVIVYALIYITPNNRRPHESPTRLGIAEGRPLIAFLLVRWCGDGGRPLGKYRYTAIVWGVPLAVWR